MAKDPAVLFYTSDFLSGTFTMTDEQVGKYIRLLCLQHQKGALTSKDMSYICSTYDVDIYSKFIKEGDFYYQKRMRDETERRKKYSESRKKNISKRYDATYVDTYEPTYVVHMETETETINETINKEEIAKLYTYYNSAIATPKITEKDFIAELYKKFGYDKTKNIIRQLAENNFKRVKTMKEALDENGNIRPKERTGGNRRKDYVTKDEYKSELESFYKNGEQT